MVFIPDIFSGWLAGARQANADNWQDLANYNSVLGGQLNNAFAMDTYDPAVRAAWDKGYNADLSTIQNAMTTDQMLQLFNLGNAAGLDKAKVAAALAGYNLQTGRNNAGLGLIDPQTMVQLAQLNAQLNALNSGSQQNNNSIPVPDVPSTTNWPSWPGSTDGQTTGPSVLDPNKMSANMGGLKQPTKKPDIPGYGVNQTDGINLLGTPRWQS